MLKVFVIGSGPIVIGQAAEFDYSGTQAIKALKEEGCQVVLLNNNPATIMTDLDLADVLYSEPMTLDSCVQIIEKEKPDAIVLGMGGQTSLNLGMKLYEAGILQAHGIRVLGTEPENIKRSEDRDLFKRAMIEIGEPVMDSVSASSLEEAIQAAETIGFPVIIRPAFTLGGFGGGICEDPRSLVAIAGEGLKKSPVHQVLVEKSVYGWKEIEYEMMRDAKGNTISVCNMENLDPVGIHTGDSIVVAPSQTLNDKQYQMLRQASIKIVSHLKIIGGCNVQFALSPIDNRYYIIEVNPRVSRSSALASKATGYAIAKIAMKIGLGYTLDEIENQVTKKTKACHEPTLDYCVVKMPRWPYDKLKSDLTTLGTVMKATGEVMAIGTTFEEALLKAIRSLDLQQHDLYDEGMRPLSTELLYTLCIRGEYNRIFALGELIRRGEPLEKIQRETHIDAYFLQRIAACIGIETTLREAKHLEALSEAVLRKIKCMGFSNQSLSNLMKVPLDAVEAKLMHMNIKPVYRMVDTCGGEFEAWSNYLYSTYHGSNESVRSQSKKIVVVGSGPIRIGQGVEFDYCSVKALQAIKKLGYEAIMINNNPETVSTDHDLSDKLYFEPITIEDVLAIIAHEGPHGVLLQFGGQTAIKLASALEARGVPLLGVTSDMIDQVEDRALFYKMLDQLKIPRPEGKTVKNTQEALAFASTVGYPVLLRPSFVIGGQDMAIIRDEGGIEAYFERTKSKYEHLEILVDQYLEGMELEVDAISDGEDLFIPGFMEHLDQAGVHSGDSISLYPARLTKSQMLTLYAYVERVVRFLQYRGAINFQFVKQGGTLYVLEVNPRASRSLPFIAKVTKTPMIQWAVSLSLGARLSEAGVPAGIMPPMDYAAVKAPVFSHEKLIGIDSLLGPNMLSTGESMFLAPTLEAALDKLLVAEGIEISTLRMLCLVSEETARHYARAKKRGLMAHEAYWLMPRTVVSESVVAHDQFQDLESVKSWLQSHAINVVVTTKDFEEGSSAQGRLLRQAAVEKGITCISSPDKFNLLIKHLEEGRLKTEIFSH